MKNTTKESALKKREVLVVDDEPEILDIFKMAFHRAGFAVRLAKTAEAALLLLKQHNINVMFLDLHLPGINGIELCRQIRKDNPMAIIHAITGYASFFEVVDCRDAGFDDYHIKPVKMKILLEAAEDAFSKIDRWMNTIKSQKQNDAETSERPE